MCMSLMRVAGACNWPGISGFTGSVFARPEAPDSLLPRFSEPVCGCRQHRNVAHILGRGRGP